MVYDSPVLENAVTYTYHPELIIVSLSPPIGTYQGGDVVDVLVQGPVLTSATVTNGPWCLFGSQMVPGQVLTDTIIRCYSPPLSMTISKGGSASGSASASAIGSAGGSGESVLDPMVSVSMGVSINGVEFFTSVGKLVSADGSNGNGSSPALAFQYWAGAVVVTSLAPSHGPVQGGTLFDVVGQGFVERNDYKCEFYSPSSSQLTPVELLGTTYGVRMSSTVIRCITPSNSFPATTTAVKVALSYGGLGPSSLLLGGGGQTQQQRRLVTTPLIFQIDPMFTLDGFTPRQISSSPSPHTKLVLHGTNFIDYPTDELLCRVGDAVSEALYLTSNTVVCLLNGQPQSPGIVSVSLTLNGQDWTSCTGPNPYLIVQTDAITLLSVAPLLGTSLGYTPITISVAGNGVVTSEHTYMCVINGISVLATQATDMQPGGVQQVTCVTPPYMERGVLSGATGIVQVSLVDVNTSLTSGNTLSYYYYPQVIVINTTSHRGPASGGTFVTYTLSWSSKPMLSSLRMTAGALTSSSSLGSGYDATPPAYCQYGLVVVSALLNNDNR